MANRKITKEQFTVGSTIDGTRIQKAFDDTYQKLNDVPTENLKQIYVPRTIYSGWQAGHFSQTYSIDDGVSPTGFFFPLYNSFSRDVNGVTGQLTEVDNPWRWKGTRIFGTAQIPAEPAGSPDIPNWTISDVVGRTWSYYLEKPCIITDISILWERDNWTGLYEEGSAGTVTNIERANADPQWWGELFLDSVFVADDKKKGSPLWRRVETYNRPNESSVRIPMSDKKGNGMVPRNGATPDDWQYDRSSRIPEHDFRPNNYQTGLVVPYTSNYQNYPVYQGWWDKNLNILVPQNSRIHFGFGLAVSKAASLYPFTPFKNDDKFQNGLRYNIAIGLLEVVE